MTAAVHPRLPKRLYVSTRGNSPPVGFCDVALAGLAPDKGLYIPQRCSDNPFETYPQVTPTMMAELRIIANSGKADAYAELAFRLFSLFVGDDIPPEDLRALCKKSYRPEIFHNREQARLHGNESDGNILDIAPIKWVERMFRGDRRKKPDDGVALIELSNGPTLAFKDFGMQFLANLIEYIMEKRGGVLNTLGATSGDTGSAAEYAFRGKKGIRVFMLSPDGKMSEFQRAQMYSLPDSNIFNIAIRGMFDDAQDIVKAVSGDLAFKSQHSIGAVNSINWVRVMAQIVYYFKGYFAVTEGDDEEIAVSVPSGNFGNAYACHVARMMGLPIGKIGVATNENDVLYEFFATGIYRPRKTSETYVTSSPSMDISKASNLERLVFDMTGGNAQATARLYAMLDETGEFDLSPGSPVWKWDCFEDIPPPERDFRNWNFVSGKSTHADRLAIIRDMWKEYGVRVDTHTADGLRLARELLYPFGLVLVPETAAACKFSETFAEATGEAPPRPAEMAGIENLPQRVEVMDADVGMIKAYIAKICGH